LSAVAARLANRIARGGPITIADYMAAALTDPVDGYYRRADPLGVGGDFTTAPEISQLFGELIGAWLIDCWIQAGRPPKVNLVELGPGRGTLMADALRIGGQMPDWLNAVELHLVEINPALRALQDKALSRYRPRWHDTLATVADGPVMLVANEFFDALPIRQLVFWDGTWRERLVDWSEDAGFHFAISPKPSSLAFLVPDGLPVEQGSLYELSPTVIATATAIAQRIADQGGAALIIDYGRMESGLGESLQAVKAHRMVPVLDNPGDADLSAHVDFGVLRRIANEAGAQPTGPVPQGRFLKALGIDVRAERLKRSRGQDVAAGLDQAVERLTGPTAMGRLFKAMAITSTTIVPAGFAPTGSEPPG
jgi:NADH dehydrogenase [ubiquinone] 1 alpha subcomplex assembly factor 7